jgi:hypothetical protein
MKDIIVFAGKGMNVEQAARAAIEQDARYFMFNDKVYRVAYEFAECGELLLDDWGSLNPSTIVSVK